MGRACVPIRGDELRALRRLQREQDPKSPFVFTSERGSPFTTAGFARLLERAGEAAGLGLKVHPHMLRHLLELCTASHHRLFRVHGLIQESRYGDGTGNQRRH